MTHDQKEAPTAWRYEVQHGPEGEVGYAWLYEGKRMVATMRTEDAIRICNAFAACDLAARQPATCPDCVALQEAGYPRMHEKCAPLAASQPAPAAGASYRDALRLCLDRYAEMAGSDLANFIAEFRLSLKTHPIPKLCRWLGYIQGVLIQQGRTTVEMERDWTRPLFRPLDFAPSPAAITSRELVERTGGGWGEPVDTRGFPPEDREPAPAGCTMGVGCDETGVCYAQVNGQPDRCEKPAPAVDTGQAVEPRAFVVVDPVGREMIVDASKYDPRKASFWLNPEVQSRHTVIPLAPITHPAPLDAERVREDERDRLFDMFERDPEQFGVLASENRAALRQKEGSTNG